MNTEIQTLIAQIKNEEVIGANTKVRIAAVLEKIAAENNPVYRALITQTGSDAPKAIVLQNTIGSTITFERNSTGTYYLHLNQELLIERVAFTKVLDLDDFDVFGRMRILSEESNSFNKFEIKVLNDSNYLDDKLNMTYIEICNYGWQRINLTEFSLSENQGDMCEELAFETNRLAYHDGVNIYPVPGDSIFKNENGSFYADTDAGMAYVMGNGVNLKVVGGKCVAIVCA